MENEGDSQVSQKMKTWNKAKNDHTRLSSEVRMIAIVMIFMLMPL